MKLFAQHGFGDSGKVVDGISSGLIQGVLLSPRDLSMESMTKRIAEIRQIDGNAAILFDPQFYATQVGLLSDSRMGKLVSDYQAYFSSKQLRDIRREKQIADTVQRTVDFQKDSLSLSQYILPNILIQDGLQSESAGIAKSFLEVSDEIAVSQKVATQSWLTLALSASCFRNEKRLETFVDEITGFSLQSKGFYLLVETSSSQGACPWHDPGILSGSMYINYALSEAGYNVVNGYSFYSAPFLSITGASVCASGWFDTLRCFSLDRFRATAGGGRRPNRKYLSNALWNRVGLQELRTYAIGFPWLVNNLSRDSLFTQSSEIGHPDEKDECLQHWEALKAAVDILTETSNIRDRLKLLLDWVHRQEKSRTQIPVLSLPYLGRRYTDSRSLRKCLFPNKTVLAF